MTNFNRRDFLKLFGLTVLASQLPIGKVDAYSEFNSKEQIGDYILIQDNSIEMVETARNLLFKQIQKRIPPKHRDRIKWITKTENNINDPFNQYFSIGWKYVPPGNSTYSKKWRAKGCRR